MALDVRINVSFFHGIAHFAIHKCKQPHSEADAKNTYKYILCRANQFFINHVSTYVMNSALYYCGIHTCHCELAYHSEA